ncbi:acyl-CoA carboxylase subunit epsilon [Streptomyces stackebrandtii]|uniref:acyl-CoA carboxylase subunit epsilon n=1 Tax=Streptomyces stackebrandtii TaxID=3051177 RepID=UPI0028DC10A2|nr:acyl-CoA carboxylase subunit epsilon [Streptomyces sp. DSM 40976]
MTALEIRIGRGRPSEEELAAVTALLCSLTHPTASRTPTPPPASWRMPTSPAPRSRRTRH